MKQPDTDDDVYDDDEPIQHQIPEYDEHGVRIKMAGGYVNGNIYRAPTEKAPADQWICNSCAESGAVPFTNDEYGVPGQDRPWCWWPLLGADCDLCGRAC